MIDGELINAALQMGHSNKYHSTSPCVETTSTCGETTVIILEV